MLDYEKDLKLIVAKMDYLPQDEQTRIALLNAVIGLLEFS